MKEKVKTNEEKPSMVLTTQSIYEKEDAIKGKFHQIEPRFFGIKMIHYTRGKTRRTWVPYYFLTYHYEVNRNVFFNKTKAFDKKGSVSVVYDANEMHAFHYDLQGDGELPMIKQSLESLKGHVISDSEDLKEVYSNAERAVQRQIIWKAYKMEGKLTLERAVKFYREAWELQVFYKGREFIKYAYLDQYGTQNERVKGLKVRMDDI